MKKKDSERFFALIKSPVKIWYIDESRLSELDLLATRMHRKDTMEGRLASLTVYHQLITELVKLTIRFTDLVKQIGEYPEKSVDTDTKGQTLGVLLRKLDESISFDGKDEILVRCNQLNSLRNKFTHNLVAKLEDIDFKKDTEAVPEIYSSLFDIFNTRTVTWFHREVKLFRNNSEFVDEVEAS